MCNAADIADGQVKSISALGTEFVAFRGSDGKALNPWGRGGEIYESKPRRSVHVCSPAVRHNFHLQVL